MSSGSLREWPQHATLSLSHVDAAIVRATEFGSGLEQRLEHGRQIECRPADHFEDVRGRSLLLQCFGELRRAGLHLLEQTHVLDRDYCLVGEGLDQLDLLVGEWLHHGSRQHEDADR